MDSSKEFAQDRGIEKKMKRFQIYPRELLDLETGSEAHKLQETVQDRGIKKRMKSFQIFPLRITGPQDRCSKAYNLQMCAL